MVMPLSATFAYVAVVPSDAPVRPDGSAGPWRAALREAVARTGSHLRDDRLVGYAPRLRIADAGLPSPARGNDAVAAPDTPDPPRRPFARPRVARSRLTLTAPWWRRPHAGVRAAHLHVARALTAVLEPGDVLHLARTGCGGLGLSVLRGGRLVAAAGAVHAVPLGDDVSVRSLPGRTLEFFERSGAAARGAPGHDAPLPVFGDPYWDQPLELRVGGRAHVLERGHAVLGGYAAYLGHGFQPGFPGTDECVALARPDACPPEAAVASAQLLALDAFDADGW